MSTTGAIEVLLADDQPLVRAGLRSIFDGEDGMAVVGEARDGAEAVRQVRRLRPDVVVMDIEMPGTDGLTATAEITTGSDTRVLILTSFDLDDYVHRALRAGASGFLMKDAEPVELIRGVRVVARGDALLAPSITRRLLAELSAGPAHPDPGPDLTRLTAREREVLGLVAAGLSNDEIAAQLVLSPATAKTHVSRIMTKTHARDRAQLVVLAYESGLAVPGWVGRPDRAVSERAVGFG